MNRDHKTEQDKKLLQLDRELLELRRNVKNSGEYIEVEPYQRGWLKYYVIRDDIKNRRDIREIRYILSVINTTIYSRKEDFKFWNYKTKCEEDMPHKLKTLSQMEWKKLSEKLQSMFEPNLEYQKSYRDGTWKIIINYTFRHLYWFIPVIESNIITHRWVPNAEIESRISEINNYLKNNFLYSRLHKLYGYSSHDNWRRRPSYKNQYEEVYDYDDE